MNEMSNGFRKHIGVAGREGEMSTLDLAVIEVYSFIGLVAIGLIVLLASNRH